MKSSLKSLAVIVIAAITFAACNKTAESDGTSEGRSIGKLISTVSYDAAAVGVVNMNQVFENAGFKLVDGKYQVPSELNMSGTAASIASMPEFADLNTVIVVISETGNDEYTTFYINNPDKLKAYIADNKLTQLESLDGFDQYALPDRYKLLVNERQAWITKRPSKVADDVKAASERHFGQNTGIIQGLEEKHTLNIALNSSKFANSQKSHEAFADTWAIANIDLNKAQLTGNVKAINSEGKPVKYPGLQTINTDFIRYTIGEPNLALAMGISPDFDWSAMRDVIGDNELAMYLPYLQMINGTVAITANVDMANDKYDFMATINSAKSDPQSLTQMILMAVQGQSTDLGNGMYRIPALFLPSQQAYFGNLNGNFFISSYNPAEANGNNDLAQIVEGKDCALHVNLDAEALSAIRGSCSDFDFGVDIMAQASNSAANFKVTLTGANDPFLLSIIKATR